MLTLLLKFLQQKDEKVFIRGRANVEEEKNGKIICEKVYSFDEAKRELWIQFENKEAFQKKEAELYEAIADSDGGDIVVIYLSAEKVMKRLPASRSVLISPGLKEKLADKFGLKNVKDVAERYLGYMDIRAEKDTFRVTVMLQQKEEV